MLRPYPGVTNRPFGVGYGVRCVRVGRGQYQRKRFVGSCLRVSARAYADTVHDRVERRPAPGLARGSPAFTLASLRQASVQTGQPRPVRTMAPVEQPPMPTPAVYTPPHPPPSAPAPTRQRSPRRSMHWQARARPRNPPRTSRPRRSRPRPKPRQARRPATCWRQSGGRAGSSTAKPACELYSQRMSCTTNV